LISKSHKGTSRTENQVGRDPFPAKLSEGFNKYR